MPVHGNMRHVPPSAIASIVLLGFVLGVGWAAPGPTFNREVVRIFQQHCQECHRPEGSAPFALVTYDHAFRRRDKILEATSGRRMPPWRPVPDYGDLAGARRLSADDIAAIRRWVEAGAPEGDAADKPSPRAFETAARRGAPDFV